MWGIGLAGVAEDANPRDGRGNLPEKLQTLTGDLGRRLDAQPGDVATRPCQAGNESQGHWIGGERHDDGNRFGRPPRGMHGWICSGNNDVNLELH